MYVFNCHAVFILLLHVAPLILLRMPCVHIVLNHVVVHLLSSDTTRVDTIRSLDNRNVNNRYRHVLVADENKGN